ncbi:hypothetical protein DFJ77DRAFT_508399 [Powellomyces hirtus]|nr:hypothetical protein DFJ77DRAFT_508399 [Powellomyces hirtus]
MDEKLPCAQLFSEVAAAHPRLDQSRKDLVNLIASSLDRRALQQYEADLAMIPLHIGDAKVLRERLNKYQTCWNETTSKGALTTLAVCSVQHSVGPFVQEWISHYLLLGASKVFIYDNSDPASDSSKRFRAAVKPFTDAGYAEVIDWYFTEGDAYRQVQAQDHCLTANRGKYEWLAMFDIDEYAVIHEPHPVCLNKFLSDASDDLGGLVIRWRGFTPHGVAIHDHQKLHLEQYQFDSNHVSFHYLKTIVNTNRTQHMRDPHHSAYKDGFWPRDAGGTVINVGVFPNNVPPDAHKHMELRHYWARDLRSGIMEKVCGKSKERSNLARPRADILLNLVAEGCCKKVEGKTRHEERLRQFLYGP